MWAVPEEVPEELSFKVLNGKLEELDNAIVVLITTVVGHRSSLPKSVSLLRPIFAVHFKRGTGCKMAFGFHAR